MKVRKICIVGDIAMIPLTRQEYAFVDADKAHIVESKNWHLVTTKGKKYAATITPTPGNRRSKTYLHRMIFGASEALQIDHINNNGLDNRLDNLRQVSSLQNKYNRSRQRNNKSGIPCVFWSKKHGKWRAEIQHQKNNIIVGYFADIEQAATAVALKRSELYDAIGMPS